MKDFGLKKLYYSISEVSKITELEQYILRYWETEFDQLRPSKNRAGNRIYTNKEIQLVLQIKKLLRDQKYTIEGAKKIIDSGQFEENIIFNEPTLFNKQTEQENINQRDIQKDLEELKQFLVDLRSKIL